MLQIDDDPPLGLDNRALGSDIGQVPKTIAPGHVGKSTRRKIVEATVRLIAEGGWAAVTTRRAAERAGVNPGLVHYYFSSVDSLLLEATTDALSSALAEPTTVLLGEGSASDRVIRFTAWLQEVDPRDPHLAVLVEALVQAPRAPALRGALDAALVEFRRSLTASILEERRHGALPRGTDAEGLALVIGALADGLVLQRVLDPSLDVVRAGRAFAALVPPRRPRGRSS